MSAPPPFQPRAAGSGFALDAPASGRHVPAFFLDGLPDQDGAVRLGPEETEHALRVLRMSPGDPAFGLDGAGGRWPLEVVEAGRRSLQLRTIGARQAEPLAGEPGAPLPWVEVAVAWPRKQRGEEMLGRLVQLGAAAITPVEARHAGAAPLPDEPPARWERLVREHTKQCGRLWLPTLRPKASCEALAQRLGDAASALLEPGASLSFALWVRSLPLGPSLLGTRARPIVLVVGPEGGLADDERGAFLEAGATPVRLGPHVLRVETAAEAALAVIATCLS